MKVRVRHAGVPKRELCKWLQSKYLLKCYLEEVKEGIGRGWGGLVGGKLRAIRVDDELEPWHCLSYELPCRRFAVLPSSPHGRPTTLNPQLSTLNLPVTSQEKAKQEFAEFVAKLKGDEKSEAQTFLFHLLAAFGHEATTLQSVSLRLRQ